MIKAIVFDFGGVLAEEGFREGLKAIGKKHGLNNDDFYTVSSELVYQTGYVTGFSNESQFWNAVRERTGINDADDSLRAEILNRFILRPEMLKLVEELRARGLITAILSDQTNWLDEINAKTPFFHLFDYVFNSFKLHKGKRDPSIFPDACSAMGLKPEEIVFVDDNRGNIDRALAEGVNAVHFKHGDDLQVYIKNLIEEAGITRSKDQTLSP